MQGSLLFVLVSSLIKIVFILIVAVGAFAPLLVWAERRQSAMIQDRLGPIRAGFTLFGRNITLAGLLHPLADALKLIFKEDFVPPKADRFLHAAAPIITLAPVVASFAVIPFADVLYLDHATEVLPRTGAVASSAAVPMQVAPLNIGILFVFAIGGTGIIGAAIAGYGSDNKYSLLGGIRAASQMVSYEVTLGLTLVPCFMVYESVRLEEMALWQSEHVWGIFVPNLTLAFVLFLTASIAESKRIPFDQPEGESEIVGGYATEYSGMRWGMFFMAEFVEIVVLGAMATVLFFGGWDLPFLYRNGLDFFGFVVELQHWVVVTLQVLFFLLKIVLFMWLQLMIRWTLPRFRYDQVMALCWKGLLPLSLVNIMVTGIVLLATQ